MESIIASGMVSGVLDITTTELADELAGGVLSAGRERLNAAASLGRSADLRPAASLAMLRQQPLKPGRRLTCFLTMRRRRLRRTSDR